VCVQYEEEVRLKKLNAGFFFQFFFVRQFEEEVRLKKLNAGEQAEEQMKKVHTLQVY
jgi:hypothetical protein